MKTGIFIALGLVALLVGCASTPSVGHKPQPVPYWQNSQWVNALVTTIKYELVYPIEMAKAKFPSGQAIVQFTYDNGRLRDAHIIKSTGNQILDSAITEQIVNIKPPLAEGLDTNMPRRFELPVNLSADNLQFYGSIRDAIQAHVYYPRSGVLHRQQGFVKVQFEYRNGHVLNSSIVQLIGSKVFGEAALRQLSQAKMPSPPTWARDKTFAFTIPFCFSFTGYICPGTHVEIQYVSSDTQTQAVYSTCTKVGFSYKSSNIVNVHIVTSSGDANLDKAALQTISKGNFPQPSTTQKEHASSFEMPVCFNNKAPNQPAAKAP